MIDWEAIAEETLNIEGNETFGYTGDPCGFPGSPVADLARRLEEGHEAGTVVYTVDEDGIDFRVVGDLAPAWV